MRIAKAIQEKRYGKARALQWMLTHSYSAKLLAVKRVTGNSGAKTPGIDGIIWTTVKQKIQAVTELKHSNKVFWILRWTKIQYETIHQMP